MAHLRALAAGLVIMGICAQADAQTPLSQDKREAEACKVTLEALKVVVPKQRWLLDQDEPKGGGQWRTIPQVWPADKPHKGWSRTDPQTGQRVGAEKPSSAMVQTFHATTPVNGARCEGVRELASQHDALNPVEKPIFLALSTRSIVGVEKAVLSADGAEALVFYHTAVGPMGGNGVFLYFRKQSDGSWREVGMLVAYVI